MVELKAFWRKLSRSDPGHILDGRPMPTSYCEWAEPGGVNVTSLWAQSYGVRWADSTWLCQPRVPSAAVGGP